MKGKHGIIGVCTTTLLATVAPAAVAAAETGSSANPTAPGAEEGEIIVYGKTESYDFEGLLAEDELDRDDIDSYGLDNVGQLIEQVTSELQQGDNRPVILINGQLANGINDVNDLPVEAVTRIQVLPPAAGARLGQSPSQRVINVVIKPDHRQVTPSASATRATRGDAGRADGELNLLKLSNGNRRSLVLRYLHVDPLLEEQRDILPDLGAIPAHPLGNVVGQLVGGEIDPALSALAGRVTLAAGVPQANARPTLFDFAALSGVLNREGANAGRTLVGESDSYSANANISQKLGSRTDWSLNARVERNETLTLRGLSTAQLRLPAGSPFSPFGNDVLLAYQVGQPLRARQSVTSYTLAQTLNTQLAGFGITAQARYARRELAVDTDRTVDTSQLQAGIANGTVNPFAGIPANLLGASPLDRSRSRADSGDLLITANRTLARLPAGSLLAGLSARIGQDRVRSATEGVTNTQRLLRRSERGLKGNLTVPLLRVGDGPRAASLTADFSGQLHAVDGSGTLRDWGGALNGNVGRILTFGATYLEEQIAPQTSALNDPVIIGENIRTFDFIRQETVLVRQISGGNAQLPVQRRRTTTLQASLRPLSDTDFVANAQYTRAVNRDIVSPLPAVNAEVQAAFPDRFRRTPDGRLFEVDARPVSFLRDGSERLSWGFRLRRTFGGVAVGEEEDKAPSGLTKGRGVRINLDVTHEHVLSAYRQARATLPTVNLLQGGALGFGGALVRDTVNFNLGVASRGVGLQVNGQYRGTSFITAGTAAAPERLTFEDRTMVNLRLFANLGPILPEENWAKGLRVSVQVANVTDSRQRVRDADGATPLRYQPFLIDPVGRSVTFSLRKAF